jgi:hypothetical protein
MEERTNGRNPKMPEFEQVILAVNAKLRELSQAMSIAVVVAIEEDVDTYAYDFGDNFRVIGDITLKVKHWREGLVADVDEAREKHRQEEVSRLEEEALSLAIA